MPGTYLRARSQHIFYNGPASRAHTTCNSLRLNRQYCVSVPLAYLPSPQLHSGRSCLLRADHAAILSKPSPTNLTPSTATQGAASCPGGGGGHFPALVPNTICKGRLSQADNLSTRIVLYDIDYRRERELISLGM